MIKCERCGAECPAGIEAIRAEKSTVMVNETGMIGGPHHTICRDCLKEWKALCDHHIDIRRRFFEGKS